ncbi:uncharacterized protein LOC133927670 [Phragmites australis]|uniref:uncharacterized protein LOC133927670 n=1 Tax=Phragmites australis TaxID=29695 RepID=UPI002D781A7F|nr:uncharacterized protein LOC133927670 [Phragmites australis]
MADTVLQASEVELLRQAADHARQEEEARRAYAVAQAQVATATIHVQTVGVLNIKVLVPVVLDIVSLNYSKWRDLFLTTLGRYDLFDYVLPNVEVDANDVHWHRMDCTVRSRLYGTISTELLKVVMTPTSTTRSISTALEDQFIGNKETHALHLDAQFCTFVQGDLLILDYCRKLKGMADALGDLSEPVQDRMLIMSVLCGLNEKFAYMAALLKRQKPFPSFIDVRSDLLLEELTMASKLGSSSTVLIATAPSAPCAPATSSSGAMQGSGAGHGGPTPPPGNSNQVYSNNSGASNGISAPCINGHN